MKHEVLQKKIQTNSAVVVEFWAPWCGPCKMMTPQLLKVEKEYSDRVKLVRINSDEDVEIAREMRIMSIPTILAFQNGKQVLRKTGALNSEQIQMVFEASLNGKPATGGSIQTRDRILRMAASAALLLVAAFTGYPWYLLAVAGIVFFTAVYDRCPIWNAISSAWKKNQA